MAVMISF